MIIFFISLLISVLLHELGHLIAAKLVKCKVEVFSIGMGLALFKKKIGETIYQIALFPIGGYCKLKDETTFSKSKYAFTNLTYSKKLFVVLAGCIINIISGGISFILGLMLNNFTLLFFGVFSAGIAITNLLPIPALDGAFPYLFLLENSMGKKKACLFITKICKTGFWFIIFLNIASIPYLIKILKLYF